MNLSTRDAVQNAFLEATRQSLARSLQTPGDWDRYKAIAETTGERLDTEQKDFERDYSARLAEAREVILREENGIRLDQPLPPGVVAQSDQAALERKADIRVRQDHERRIAVIKTDELDQYRALTADIRTRNAPETTQTPDQSQDRSGHRSGPSQD